MVYSVNQLIQAWRANITHVIDYFGSSKMSAGTNGYNMSLIYIAIMSLIIITAVFTIGRRK